MGDRPLTASEEEELASLLMAEEYDTVISDAIQETLTLEEDPAFEPSAAQQRIQGILDLDKTGHRLRVVSSDRRLPVWRRQWLRYAAAVLVVTVTAIWFIHDHSRRSRMEGNAMAAITDTFPNIAPGGNRAILTLDDGSTIALDSMPEGSLSQQGSAAVFKVSDGLLSYRPVQASGARGKVFYNTIATPKGGQYQVKLPDGTKVWLNAASSIRFPTTFPGPSREVSLTGEAYFEIAPDARRPFYTRVKGMSVEVLGTSFNINAYPDEKVMRTTLLDGRVKINTVQASAIMRPGQQAAVSSMEPDTKKAGLITLTDNADPGEAVAWKNGLFYLAGTDIASLIRQVGRWYDIEVVFEGPAPLGHITGKVPRNTTLPKILRLLRASGVHFKMEENKIIVTP